MKKYLITPSLLVLAFGAGAGTTLATVGSPKAKATVVESKPCDLNGIANAAQETTIETGIGLVALTGINNKCDTALAFAPGTCPIEHIELICQEIEGEDTWIYQIKSKALMRESQFTEQ